MCIHFELLFLLLMCCWAADLSLGAARPEIECARGAKAGLQLFARCVVNVDSGHLEFITIGTSDRMVKLTKEILLLI